MGTKQIFILSPVANKRSSTQIRRLLFLKGLELRVLNGNLNVISTRSVYFGTVIPCKRSICCGRSDTHWFWSTIFVPHMHGYRIFRHIQNIIRKFLIEEIFPLRKVNGEHWTLIQNPKSMTTFGSHHCRRAGVAYARWNSCYHTGTIYTPFSSVEVLFKVSGIQRKKWNFIIETRN